MVSVRISTLRTFEPDSLAPWRRSTRSLPPLDRRLAAQSLFVSFVLCQCQVKPKVGDRGLDTLAVSGSNYSLTGGELRLEPLEELKMLAELLAESLQVREVHPQSDPRQTTTLRCVEKNQRRLPRRLAPIAQHSRGRVRTGAPRLVWRGRARNLPTLFSARSPGGRRP